MEPVKPKIAEVATLVQTLTDSKKRITNSDREKIAYLLISSGISIAMLETKSERLRKALNSRRHSRLAREAIYKTTETSFKFFRNAPSTVDPEIAIKAAEKLRNEISVRNTQTRNMVAGLKFAVRVAGKFL